MGAGEGTGGNGGDAARNCSRGQYLSEQERRSRGDLHVSSEQHRELHLPLLCTSARPKTKA